MWPHPQQYSHLLSGPVLVKGSTRYHTPAALLPSLNYIRATLLPFTTKTTDDSVISPPLTSLLDSVGACQPPYLHRDRYLFVLSVDFIPYLLQALCAFSHVPDQWYRMDLAPLPGLVFFNINHSCGDCAGHSDDDVAVS